MNRPRRRRESPPATHDDDRRARRSSETPGDDGRSDGDDNRRLSGRPAPEYDGDGYENQRPLIEWCLDNRDLINDEFEIPFLISLYGFRRPSKPQWRILDIIADKVDLGIRVLGPRNGRRRR
jgi:hypothetical protein